jgi:catechol 2,3-dioxygenase-like lactoylglutathione lyase family enzyme
MGALQVWVPSLARAEAAWGWLLPGLNHLSFHAGTPAFVDRLVDASRQHGWSLLFADRHPYAGGPDTYAAYLEDADGYEVELVAET